MIAKGFCFYKFYKKEDERNLYADSAYKSKDLKERIKNMGVKYSVRDRVNRNKPLT